MQRSPRTAAVRLPLLTLLAAALALALVEPALGGTQDAPEIQDPANDQAVLDETALPTCAIDTTACLGTRIDVLSVWIDAETATTFNVNILLSNAPAGATSASSQWDFHATYAGTEVVATVTAAGGATTTGPTPGANVAAAAADGNTLIMTINKSVFGTVSNGSPLTGLFVSTVSTLPSPLNALPLPVATDRAPNEGAGTDYVFTGGGVVTDPNDTDGDGLNDTCEQTYFGNLTAQNATGDPDGDGLTNGQECALGTDPTKADTDGDGVNDKDDPFPTDPTKGGKTSSTTTTTSRTSTTTTTSRTTTSTSSSTTSDDSVENLDDAIEKLKGDVGYLGLSSGGFLAVLVLAIIGLAVRWSL